MYSDDYLLKNGITDIEELVGKSVYLIFPVQGIVRYKIRRVQYGKQQEWLLCVPETYKVSELGKSIFFTKEEAEKYQLQQLDKYSNEQRERIVKQKIEERNKELEDLNDVVRGSDPVTNEKTMGSESELLSLVQELDEAIKNGSEDSCRDIIKKIKNTLIERNTLCKAGK